MLKTSAPIARIAALAAFAGSLAFMSPVAAAPADTSEPPASEAGQSPAGQPPAYQTAPSPMHHHGAAMKSDSHQDMRMHVEDRIKTLHAKLAITPEQEPKWNDFAQVMRDNEANIDQLVQERHQDPENMTAVDDLQSYQKIAQAHVDGLQKLIPAFQDLYNDMSGAQKQKADEAFGRFEGHRGDKAAKKSM